MGEVRGDKRIRQILEKAANHSAVEIPGTQSEQGRDLQVGVRNLIGTNLETGVHGADSEDDKPKDKEDMDPEELRAKEWAEYRIKKRRGY